jgi:hypothetical protein
VPPTKYETAFSLQTAKALGLTIRETLLATADEVPVAASGMVMVATRITPRPVLNIIVFTAAQHHIFRPHVSSGSKTVYF